MYNENKASFLKYNGEHIVHPWGRHMSMVSCQKGPTRHAYAWQIGPFWQDALDVSSIVSSTYVQCSAIVIAVLCTISCFIVL